MVNNNNTKMIVKPGVQEIIVIREFDAPRELVFKAWTTASLYSQWIGPRDHSTIVERMDAKSGGSWRYVQTDPAGGKHTFHGFYHEVARPERVVDTFEYDNLPEKGHAVFEAINFDELPDTRTLVTERVVFLSVADRDGMVGSGMEMGVVQSHERLDELLKKIRSKDSLEKAIK
jgi:uncharacterized protein YndB with AHSA1/START domain